MLIDSDSLFGRAWAETEALTPDEFLETNEIPEPEFMEFADAVAGQGVNMGTFGAAFQMGYNVRKEQEDAGEAPS